MSTDVYHQLAKHLDNLPSGYPRTDSGVEMRILHRLFSSEEAALALHLTLIPEEARVIARRAKIPIVETTRRLEEMERKGLIIVWHQEGKAPKYAAAGYFVGFYELQVNRLDPAIVQDFEEYGLTWWDNDIWKKAPQMRTIPVGESISAPTEVMPYERAEALVRAGHKLSAAPCICRRDRRIAGEGCDNPLETCLALGMVAEYYVHNGLGREISQDEALQILKLAEEAGLVLQPNNAREVLGICTCCGCCCRVLRGVKRHPRPASVASTPFQAKIDLDTCEGCGTCKARCEMEAISLDDGHAVLNLDRCIGCGLCVTTCPTESLSMARKPDAAQPYVPKDFAETNVKLGRARGKLGTGELVSMLVKSKVDRLLAPKRDG